MTKKITVTEYASMIGKTRQAILKRIKLNQPLIGIKKVEKVGSMWLLYQSTELS